MFAAHFAGMNWGGNGDHVNQFMGTFLFFSGLNAALLEAVQPSLAPGAQFGHASASLSQPDAVGPPQWAASAPFGDLGASNDHGAVTLYSDSIQLGEIFCSGDGTAAPCPCGNSGAPDHGCANGDNSSAHLRCSGTTSVAAASLFFNATWLTPGEPALLYSGVNRIQSGQGVLFGDGLRCTGGAVVRLGVQFSNPIGEAFWAPELPWPPGTERHFQVWYRNTPAPACGSGFNLSNGYTVVFTP